MAIIIAILAHIKPTRFLQDRFLFCSTACECTTRADFVGVHPHKHTIHTCLAERFHYDHFLRRKKLGNKKKLKTKKQTARKTQIATKRNEKQSNGIITNRSFFFVLCLPFSFRTKRKYSDLNQREFFPDRDLFTAHTLIQFNCTNSFQMNVCTFCCLHRTHTHKQTDIVTRTSTYISASNYM